MEGHGHVDCNAGGHSMTTTDSVESINGGLAKSLSEVLNPHTSSPIHVMLRQQPCACVSRPLRDVTAGPGQPTPARGTRLLEWKPANRAPVTPAPGCTAQPRACGSKYHLSPSSWARAVPISRLRLASCPESVLSCNLPCACPSTPCHDRFSRKYQWWTCKEPQRGAQSAHFVAQRCR